MTSVMKINGAKSRIARVLRSQYTIKLAAGLALGALLLSATTGFPFENSDANTQKRTASGTEGVANAVAHGQMVTSVEESGTYDMSPEGTHWGTAFPVCWGMNHPICPSYEQQRSADRHQENLDILQGMRASGIGDAKMIASSYEQQRSADSIQERLEVQQVLQDKRILGKPSSAERVVCETGDYPLHHELFDEVWQNLMGRPPSSQPTACEVDKYVLRSEPEEMLFGEMWDIGGSKFNVNQADPEKLQDAAEFFGEDVVATGYEVLIARLNRYQADGPLTSSKLERLDQEIDLLRLAVLQKQWTLY